MSVFESVLSSVKTPAQFVADKTLFSIPSYQRPYVWSDEAIKSLFDDLYRAYKDNPKGHYYVGTILTAQSNDGTFELIDGQQRTTSLMLLALACKKQGIVTELTQLICAETLCESDQKIKRQLRLVFKIREQVEAYLGHMAGLADYDNKFPGEAEVEKNPYLKRLAGGLATFENLLEQIAEVATDKENESGGKVKSKEEKKPKNTREQQNFANYVYNNMRIVNNLIPRSTDLNQLFATMNNSGIQLEQADILKSLLFKSITTDKAVYNAIWQACENMDNYFERNVRQVFPKTPWRDLSASDFAKFDTSHFKLKLDEPSDVNQESSDNAEVDTQRGLTIAEIVHQAELEASQSNKNSDNKNANKDSQLLLHAYRIYLHKYNKKDFEPRFHSDQLINTFKPLTEDAEEQDIKDFIECLWQVRYAFDAWVVKWVEKADEDEEQLIICNVSGPSKSQNSYYFNRTTPVGHSNLSLLQMVRHFTADRNAQYWLTSFLGWLVGKPTVDDKQVLVKLESLDNQLSLANIEQKPASFILLKRDLTTELQDAKSYLDQYLNEEHGVRFRHYWFQKLEYLLRKHQAEFLPSINNSKFNKYRIISRNSVEHVHPQHEEYEQQLKDGFLNSFGNLALLNVSQNSAYSNQDVAKKRIDFQAKLTYDSLKLKHVFDLMSSEKWDEERITKHQNQMIELLKRHYTNDNDGVLNV